MRRRRFGTLALVGLASVCLGRAAQGAVPAPVQTLPFASDLRKDVGGRQGARLVVVLFSLPDCVYCEAIRREQLLPLSTDPAHRGRLVVREISITGSRAMFAFDGHETNEATFAKQSAARFSPTVAFFGPAGTQVSEPIVGALLADFYGAYLDRAVRNGIATMDGANR